jgi:hypothetical protein
MKQETLEEAAEHNYPNGDVWTEEQAVIRRLAFKNGAKWQAERMYSEEDMIEFTQTMIMQYKFGNTNIEQLDLLKESLERFKNK